MLFKNRHDAGCRLARALQDYRGRQPLVLAIPRGGVVVAAPMVAALAGELDLIISRKVGLPGSPELAVAAVAPDGTVLYNQSVMRSLNLVPADLKSFIEGEVAEIKRRLEVYRGHAGEPEITGRVVIVVDDGVATGLTTEAALRSVKQANPARLVLAVPVAPPETAERLRSLVDDLICLATPVPFYAVGQFYEDFSQVSDDEVKNILKKYKRTF
ncbi:phosphoribosyltransferase [Moorella sp. E306M]|jgi:predicted phosphoribosyltransferase|uniref:phosphoribosyltransferase n=1 Tax=Moorella sp. E306M TaxID=2572683 RepID=UPI0010FFBF4E|nr:phosphoribosyltransferase family protein [Moorella sp. E306M]MDK2894128.1 putative phosphoribosyl transferase [Moorella sp. (in: firmicutes)]GEA18181.1 phosphoribosyltransferase [Moorella sp. E306M]